MALVLFLLLADACSYCVEKHILKKMEPNEQIPKYFLKMNSFEEYYQLILKNILRKPEGLIYKKRSIIIFGCSFAYGDNLKNQQTFSYKLSHITKRPIFNRACGGWGIQHMLYQLQKESFLDTIKNPEYVIYVFFDHQISRFYLNTFEPMDKYFYLRYGEKRNNLYRKNLNILEKIINASFTFKLAQKHFSEYLMHSPKFYNVNFNLMKLHFLESKKLIQEKYPNSKIVILKYKNCDNSWYINTERWQELQNEGFIILDTYELTGKLLEGPTYTISETDLHPNEKAWNLIVPALIKKLNL